MTTPETGPPSDSGRPPPTPQPPQAAGALRLTYEYEGNAVRLVAQQRVDVDVAGFDVQQSFVARHVVDVMDADGATLVRIPVHNDLGVTTEVFGHPGEPITRLPDPNPRGAFTVIVPVPRNAARAVLQRLGASTAPADPAIARAAAGNVRCLYRGRALRRPDRGGATVITVRWCDPRDHPDLR